MSKRLWPCHSNFTLTFSGAGLFRARAAERGFLIGVSSVRFLSLSLFFSYYFIFQLQVERLSLLTSKTGTSPVESDEQTILAAATATALPLVSVCLAYCRDAVRQQVAVL